MFEWLKITIENNTVAHFLIGALLGTVLGAVLKFVIDNYFSYRIMERRSINKLIKSYTKPLANSALSLERGINGLIRNKEKNWLETDEYFKANLLYRFGLFLGWLHVLKKESTFLEFNSKSKTKKMEEIRQNIFGALTSGYTLKEYYTVESLLENSIQKGYLEAVGECMIIDSKPISFSQFVDGKIKDPEHFRWLDILYDFLIKSLNNDVAWDRLIYFENSLQRFIWFLDSRYLIVPKDGREVVNLEHVKSKALLKFLLLDSKKEFPGVKIKNEDKVNNKIKNNQS